MLYCLSYLPGPRADTYRRTHAYSKQEEGPRQTLPYTLRCRVISERVKGCTTYSGLHPFWLIPILADTITAYSLMHTVCGTKFSSIRHPTYLVLSRQD